MRGGATMILPGETEAGSAGMHATMPRDSLVGLIETMLERGSSSRALPKLHRIERPPCLENPRPKGRNPAHERKRYLAVHADQDNRGPTIALGGSGGTCGRWSQTSVVVPPSRNYE